MPHFGLIDEGKLSEADAALLRCRLHLRGARRRFERGMLPAGIASLYDALQHAVRWYIMAPERRAQLDLARADRLDDRELFQALVRGRVLASDFDFDEFESLVEMSLDDSAFTFDAASVYAQVEEVMGQLEVVPFDEAGLPGIESSA
jgi:hypothetical protein